MPVTTAFTTTTPSPQAVNIESGFRARGLAPITVSSGGVASITTIPTGADVLFVHAKEGDAFIKFKDATTYVADASASDRHVMCPIDSIRHAAIAPQTSEISLYSQDGATVYVSFSGSGNLALEQ